MPGTSDESKTPGRTRSTRLSLKDAGTPAGTPTRITRRTSLLDETVAESTPTRQTRSTRRNSVDVEAAEAPPTPRRMTRRTSTEADIVTPSTITTRTRRSSVEQEHIPTPARITRRRSPSIQSNDGAQPQSVAKAPAEPTIMEVDDMETVPTTPGRRSRKTPVIPAIIEEEDVSVSPSRPVTRSMSQSPASVISPKKNEEINQTRSPLTSPKKSTKLASNSTSSQESTTDKTKEISTKNKLNDSTEVVKSTPLKEVKSSGSEESDLKLRVHNDDSESTTQETIQSQNSVTKKERKKNKEMFSRSWSQPVVSQYKEAIDTFNLNKSAGHLSLNTKVDDGVKQKKKSMVVESSSDDDEEIDETDEREDNFLDDEAEVADDYLSGDSMDEEEKEAHEEELKAIESQGIDLGSEDSEDYVPGEEDEDDEDDSFIATDENVSLLSYSDEDDGAGEKTKGFDSDEENNEKGSEKKKKKKRVLTIVDDSDSDQDQKSKPSPAKELQKIRVLRKISTGDPEVSFKPTEVTIFDAEKINRELTDIDEEGGSPKEKSLSKSVHEDDKVKKRRKSLRVSDADRLSLSPMKNSTVLKGDDELLDASVQLPKVPHNSVISDIGDKDITVNGANEQLIINKSCNDVEPMDISVTESFVKLNSSQAKKNVSVNASVQKFDEESSDDEYEEPDSVSENESDVEMNNGEQNEENVPINGMEEVSKKKKKSVENVNELGAKFRESQLNSLSTVTTPEQLKSITERCEKILREKKEERKTNSALYKKKKVEKKKLKDAEKEISTEDNDESGLKKKKKKKRNRRKYNKDLTLDSEEPTEPNEKIKQKLETIERRRQKNKEKKLAKRQKLQAAGVEIVKRVKATEGTPAPVVEKEPKKKKTLLTAFEAKKMIFGEPELKIHKESKPRSSKQENTSQGGTSDEKDKKVQEPQSKKNDSILQESSHNNSSKPEKKEKIKNGTQEIQKPKIVHKDVQKLSDKKEDNSSDSKNEEQVAKTSKKKREQTDNHNKENQDGKLLKIISGFNEIPVTPEVDRLRKNRGFVEQPATPHPIGFKVSSVLPSGQEYTQRKTKKRKRNEKEITEPPKAPPKPVWSASGAFEEIEISPKFISLNANTATEFKLAVLQQPPTKKRLVEGLSSFKHKAMYEQKSNLRQTSKDLLRQEQKQKLLKKGKNYKKMRA